MNVSTKFGFHSCHSPYISTNYDTTFWRDDLQGKRDVLLLILIHIKERFENVAIKGLPVTSKHLH